MISIVIPNYNGSEKLAKNVPKLLAMLQKSKVDYEVIIVDDASNDNSIEVVEELTKQKYNGRGFFVTLIKREKNEGFSSTTDRGIRAAKGEFVFVIKNDAIPQSSDYFKLLLEPFKNNSKIFSVTAGLKTFEQGREELRGQGILKFFRGFFLHFRSQSEYQAWLQTMRSTRNSFLNTKYQILNTKLITAWPDGGASVFRKDLYLKLGGFEKLFNPAYWEDVDLGYRAWKAGYECLWEPKAVLLHDFEGGSVQKKYGSQKVKLMNLEHQFAFLWCNADLKYLLKYFFWIPVHYAISLKNGDPTFIKAHFWSKLHYFHFLMIRQKRKPLHKFSDDEVLAKFN